eukprot:m.88743 g.88743  ORF g.88743 m.88743 type:complete len:53 (-) comp13185_c0_seq3:325-483(-)
MWSDSSLCIHAEIVVAIATVEEDHAPKATVIDFLHPKGSKLLGTSTSIVFTH